MNSSGLESGFCVLVKVFMLSVPLKLANYVDSTIEQHSSNPYVFSMLYVVLFF